MFTLPQQTLVGWVGRTGFKKGFESIITVRHQELAHQLWGVNIWAVRSWVRSDFH